MYGRRALGGPARPGNHLSALLTRDVELAVAPRRLAKSLLATHYAAVEIT